MTRPIFVVGCPRSGTTLVRDLLRSHPNVTIAPETHFIPIFYRAFAEPASSQEVWQLARRILGSPRVARWWRISAAQPDFAACRTFSDVTRRVFELWAAKEGKPRWGDKTPHYVREIPLLLRLFPDAQIVHIVRDGRDVALSWVETRFEPGNLYVAARMWNEMVTKGRQDGTLLPPGSYLELRYESLLAEPEATMRSLCAFLNEPFDPAVLTPNRIAWDSNGAPTWTRGPDFRVRIVGGNAGGWRSRMSLRRRTLFESVAGGLLSELGYPVEGLARKISPGEKLLWETAHMMQSLSRKLRRLRRPSWRRTAFSLAWATLRRRGSKRRSAERARD